MSQPGHDFNEELSQSKARVIHSALFFFIYLLLNNLRTEVHSQTVTSSFTIVISYHIFAIGWYFMVKRSPNLWPARRYVSLLADMSIITAGFHLLGQNSAVAYPLFMWVLIGNGIRFGERFLVVGIGLGVVLFSSIVLYAPYWRDNVELSMGLLAGVAILPLFFFGVLKRLKAIHELEFELKKSRLADQAKDEFLATMSHELRTPMNGVLGMADTLHDTIQDPEQKEQLNVITRSVESLLHTITGILDYSEIAQQNRSLAEKPFDLRQVLTDVRLLMDSAAQEKGLVLHFEYPADQRRYFRGDPDRILQLVLNLVGNAVKFTPDGHVTLRCRVDDDGADTRVTLEIEDTGIGISEDCQSTIFDHFEQADGSMTRLYDGVGLGLTISRKLARMMGGDVQVKSRLGAGSMFTADLCLEPCDDFCETESSAEREWPDFGYRALVVEDNKFNQVVVQKMLQKIGITCEIAENGKQALVKLDQEDFDLVFMDIRMPLMNGYEATEYIRARDDQVAGIPILALTGEATPSDVAKCLGVGMNLHLSKPVRLETLVESVESLAIAVAATS